MVRHMETTGKCIAAIGGTAKTIAAIERGPRLATRPGAARFDSVADVTIVATLRTASHTNPSGTSIAGRAGIALTAGASIRLRRIGTLPRAAIASSRVMALVLGAASHRVGSGARPRLARIRLGTGVAVAAGAAIGFGRVGAKSADAVASSHVVALVLGAAGDGVGSGTNTGLASIALGAGIAVIAGISAQGRVRT